MGDIDNNLGAWLSEETMAMREEVYEILPFILTLSNETFEYQKLTKLSALPGRGATDFSDLLETSSSTILCKPGENVSSRQAWFDKMFFN